MLPCGEGTSEGLREHHGSELGLEKRKEDSDVFHPTGYRLHWCCFNLSTEAQTTNGNPKCLEAQSEATSIAFLGNLLVSHMTYTQYDVIQDPGTRKKQAWSQVGLSQLLYLLKPLFPHLQKGNKRTDLLQIVGGFG